MSAVVVTLEESDLAEVKGILESQDELAALRFVEKRIVTRLPCPGASLCDSNRQNPFLMKRD